MANPAWTFVDEYAESLLVGHDAVLDAALEASAAAGLPAIAVRPHRENFLA